MLAFNTTKTSIDGAGRIVVPEALRQQLSFSAGDELDNSVVDGRLEIAVPARDFEVDHVDGLPRLRSGEEMPQLSATLTRDVLEQTRR